MSLCLVVLSLLASSCHNPAKEVHFARFERLLFGTDPDRLQEELLLHRAEYNTPLLNCAPNDPYYMQAVSAFVSDPTMQYVFHVTDSLDPLRTFLHPRHRRLQQLPEPCLLRPGIALHQS